MGRKARQKREQREKGGLEPRPAIRRRSRKWVIGTLLAVLIGGGVGA